jgi:hypothetical protein
MVITDPHWGKVLNFNPAIPLWPEKMSSSWNKEVFSKYSISGYPQNKNNWQLYMSAHGWEKITVPAVTSLHYAFRTSLILKARMTTK